MTKIFCFLASRKQLKDNSFNLIEETFISTQLHSVESLFSLSLLALSCVYMERLRQGTRQLIAQGTQNNINF